MAHTKYNAIEGVAIEGVFYMMEFLPDCYFALLFDKAPLHITLKMKCTTILTIDETPEP